MLPPCALDEVGRVFTYGADKYSTRNWELGMEWGRLYAASLRHLNAFWWGENSDPDSGLLHLAHAVACIMMLLNYQINSRGTDTRPTIKLKHMQKG